MEGARDPAVGDRGRLRWRLSLFDPYVYVHPSSGVGVRLQAKDRGEDLLDFAIEPSPAFAPDLPDHGDENGRVLVGSCPPKSRFDRGAAHRAARGCSSPVAVWAEITGADYAMSDDIYGHGAVPGGEYAAIEIGWPRTGCWARALADAVYEDTRHVWWILMATAPPPRVGHRHLLLSTGGARRSGSWGQEGGGPTATRRARTIAVIRGNRADRAASGPLAGDRRNRRFRRRRPGRVAYVDRPTWPGCCAWSACPRPRKAGA